MSEDDRAAKAARAKAMLKKRQQKKAADISSSAVDVNTLRTLSPTPSEPVEENGRDLGDVFSKDTSDSSWLSSLPRAASPPLPVPPSSPRIVHQRVATNSALPSSNNGPLPLSDNHTLQEKLTFLSQENETLVVKLKELQMLKTSAEQAAVSLASERKRREDLQENYRKLQDDTAVALENEHRTVSLLVTEKAHLSSELKKREAFESKVQTLEDQFEAEKNLSNNLNSQLSQLRTEMQFVLTHAQKSELNEKELSDRNKEQERELQIVSASAAESQKEAENSLRKLRELEEQIQGDDRLERLENSLKHTQDRADELEFQLTKLKQAHGSLKSEKERLENDLKELSIKEIEESSKISDLDSQLSATRTLLSNVEKERDSLSKDKIDLQQLSEIQAKKVRDFEDKLFQAATAVASNNRQLQNAQSDLKNAIRRADDAEKSQKNLQLEGTNLMRSLDEMRPKIVELTGAKMELAEKVDSLEHILRNRDSLIIQLENDIEEAREQGQQMDKVWKDRLSEQEKWHKDALSGTSDIQKAYSELQEELDIALSSLRNLETQRTNQHQEAVRRFEEIERLTNQCEAQANEVDALRHELNGRREANDEEQDFLDRTQNEIEALRVELNARESEIERLRDTVISPFPEGPKSLDDELHGSVHQQYVIDLSNAMSQIRALESTIYGKDTINHNLQKQINALEEQLAQMRSGSLFGQRSFSPASSRPPSRAAKDVSRTSLNSHRPHPPLSRAIFDHAMTPETLHKRKVSLSMLKARIESEVKSSSSLPPSRALSPVPSEGHSRTSSATYSHVHRPQFLDESHVFWCHSCQGDLVIL